MIVEKTIMFDITKVKILRPAQTLGQNLTRLKGFSLIELMVAMFLGGIMLGGFLSIIAANKQTVALQRNLSAMKQESSLALEVIADDLRMAGSGGVNARGFVEFFGKLEETGAGLTFADDDTNYDVLVVSRLGKKQNLTLEADDKDIFLTRDGDETDCLGELPPTTGATAGLITHIYHVDKDKNLRCGNIDNSTGEIMVSNVEAFQVLYGIDLIRPATDPALEPCQRVLEADYASPDDASGIVNCHTPSVYVTGAELRAALNGQVEFDESVSGSSLAQYVKTVRMALVVGSEDDHVVDIELGKKQDIYAFEYRLVDGVHGVDLSDGKLIKVFVKTVALMQAQRD